MEPVRYTQQHLPTSNAVDNCHWDDELLASIGTLLNLLDLRLVGFEKPMRKRILVACVSMLLLSLFAEATVYTVKQTGGGNFTTIQACANAMANGDICTVYAGTYIEHVMVPAGAAGAYKTLQVNGTDVVSVYDFTLNSYTKIIGFNITNTNSDALANNCVSINSGSRYINITGNTFASCGIQEAIHAGGSGASYIFVQNNVLTWPCSSPSSPDVCYGVGWNGDHWLIEGNDISHTLEGITGAGTYSVIRNNTYHDTYGTDPLHVLPEHDCTPTYSGTVNTNGTNIVSSATGNNFALYFPGAWIVINGTRYLVLTSSTSSMTVGTFPSGGATSIATASGLSASGGHGSNCHMNMVISEPSTPTPVQHNVIESNSEYNLFGGDAHVFLAQGDGCGGQCFGLIIRFNTAAHVGSAGIIDDNNRKANVNPGFYAVKSYNNSWVDLANYGSNATNGITNVFTYNSKNGSEINDLFYYPRPITALNPYVCDDRGTGASTCSSFVARNNLAWCAGATCNLHGQIYSQGSFTADPGNIKVDPKFTNYASDISLSGNSPGVGAGSYLTTVAVKDLGEGRALLVNDAAFFQDGYGIPSVQADQIRIGTSTVVRITSINYTTNTLNLAESVVRLPGDPIYLFSDSTGRVVLFGNEPNIGALPSGVQQTPAPPTGLTVTVS